MLKGFISFFHHNFPNDYDLCRTSTSDAITKQLHRRVSPPLIDNRVYKSIHKCVYMYLVIPNEQACGDIDKEKLPETARGRKLETQKGTQTHLHAGLKTSSVLYR